MIFGQSLTLHKITLLTIYWRKYGGGKIHFEETADLIHDNEALDKWGEIVSELGLSGQTKIVKKDKSPIPFLWMNQTLVRVFETLCPTKVDIADYDKTPIPVELLELVKMSFDEKYFTKIEVWYDDKSVDPVIVGAVGFWGEMTFYVDSNKSLSGKEYGSSDEVIAAGGMHPYYNAKNRYLIGRWADMSRSLEELRKMAKEKYIELTSNEAREQINVYTRKLQDVEIEANRLFS